MNTVPPIPAQAARALRRLDDDAAWVYRALWTYTHVAGVSSFTEDVIEAAARLRSRYPDAEVAGRMLAMLRGAA